MVAEGSIPTRNDEASEGLSYRQKAFLAAYVKHWNASKAARAASYAPPYNVSGAKVLASQRMQECLRETREEFSMVPDEVLARLFHLATATLEDFIAVDPDTRAVHLDLRKPKETGQMGFVKRIRFSASGVISLELIDVQNALFAVARIQGLVPRPSRRGRRDQERSNLKNNRFDEIVTQIAGPLDGRDSDTR